nr:Gfo/Idh/MocA family oxidoreductase [Cerasicoccus arenae]
MDSGVIGKVHQVNLEYLLNTSHGADYFRRWHSYKKDSGGLLVHKSTHHFDLVNWWIDGIPEAVFAHGNLSFYGRDNAIKRGDGKYTEYPRYHGIVGHEDPFAFLYEDLCDDDIYNRHLYLEAEKESGYQRDQNVFRDGIDIEDTMNVMVRYRHGPLLNYSLNAYSPDEGYRVSFMGDRGRIEFEEKHGAHILNDDGSKKQVDEHAHAGGHRLVVHPHFKAAYDVEIEHAEGGHGGADPLLQAQLFAKDPPKDPFGRHAGHEQGAASILIGIAANQSMIHEKQVRLLDLANLRPDASHLSELI